LVAVVKDGQWYQHEWLITAVMLLVIFYIAIVSWDRQIIPVTDGMSSDT